MIVITIEDIIGISAIVLIAICFLWAFISTKIEERKIKKKIRRKRK